MLYSKVNITLKSKLSSTNQDQEIASKHKGVILIKRWRFFQLYLMLESIFSGYLSPLSREDDKLKKSITFLTDNQIWIFYRPDLAESERKQKLFQYIH